MKRPWQSRTLLFNFLAFIALWGAYHFYPNYHKAMCGNAEVILSIVMGMNMLLRRFTKEAISIKSPTKFLFLLFLLSSCASVDQKLDPELFYKRDLGLEINGQYYEGVTVLPKSLHYAITVVPPGDIDLMLIRTCHREFTVEKENSGWKLFGKKQKFTYDYTPIHGIEDTRTCPLRVDVFESEKGKHSWGMIDFENELYTLQADLTCNGSYEYVNGIAACQAKVGTVQRISFKEPIRYAEPSPGCEAPEKTKDGYEIKTALGECLYHFDSRDHKIGRLLLVGYEGVLIRNTQ